MKKIYALTVAAFVAVPMMMASTSPVAAMSADACKTKTEGAIAALDERLQTRLAQEGLSEEKIAKINARFASKTQNLMSRLQFCETHAVFKEEIKAAKGAERCAILRDRLAALEVRIEEKLAIFASNPKRLAKINTKVEEQRARANARIEKCEAKAAAL